MSFKQDGKLFQNLAPSSIAPHQGQIPIKAKNAANHGNKSLQFVIQPYSNEMSGSSPDKG